MAVNIKLLYSGREVVTFWKSPLPPSCVLKTKAVGSPDMLVCVCQTTSHHIQRDSNCDFLVMYLKKGYFKIAYLNNNNTHH
jgi:hypothetical protein